MVVMPGAGIEEMAVGHLVHGIVGHHGVSQQDYVGQREKKECEPAES